MHEIISGTFKGKKWIAGSIPMKHGVVLDVDTRSGLGVSEILAYLRDFINYQAVRMNLPSYSTEDVVQELSSLAIAAIPEYDASKCANMLTFLQNHIRNRIINIYKFATEQRRTAVHGNFRFCKIKCPACNRYSVFDDMNIEIKFCTNCGYKKQEGERWRKYPVPISLISSNEPLNLPDGSHTTIQEHCSYEDVGILGSKTSESEPTMLSRVAVEEVIKKLDDTSRKISLMLMEDYSISEIARNTKLSNAQIRSRIRKLAKNKELARIFIDYKEGE